jgi:hypothetical protein
MSSTKRPRNDENSYVFKDMSTPVPKRPRRKAQSVSLAEIQNMQQVRAERDTRKVEALKGSFAKVAEEHLRAESKARVEKVLSSITDAGYESLYDFVDELLNSRDQQISARVSRMLGRHGEEILNSIRARQPDLASRWAVDVSGEILAQEGQKLANYLRPEKDAKISNILQSFSLERIMSDIETIAPTLCMILRQVSMPQSSDPDETGRLRKDCGLVCHFFCYDLFEIDSAPGTCDCCMHARADSQRKVERISDHDVYLSARLWCIPHAIRCPQSRGLYSIIFCCWSQY